MNRRHAVARLMFAYAITARKDRPMRPAIWNIVGVLAIILLLILIVPHFR